MSSSIIPSATSTSGPTDSTPKNDVRILTVVVVLGIVGMVLVAVVVRLSIRAKRRIARESTSGPFHGISILDSHHPATQITPFGAPRNAPQFEHTPGADMRIAYRRPDGAWHFADSRTPFKPVGVSELDVTPSPASASFVFPFSPALSRKEEEALAEQKAWKGDDIDYDDLTPPPPAYQANPKEDRGNF